MHSPQDTASPHDVAIDGATASLRVEVARLSARVSVLEKRLLALETPAPAGLTNARAGAAYPSGSLPDAPDDHLPLPDNQVPAIGKAVLGMAGAYLLRQVAESHTIPFAFAIGLAMLYAGGWLVAAVRARRPFSTAAFSTTAVLILAPMLWEVTVRFQAIPAAASAAALVVFSVAAMILAWPQNQAPTKDSVAWIAVVPSALAALALLIATRDLAPWTTALLAVAIAAEYAAFHDRWTGLRWVAAAAASLAVLNVVVVTGRPEGLPADYAALSDGRAMALECALFAVYAVSLLLRATMPGRAVTLFEMWQPMIALWLASAGVLRVLHLLTPGSAIVCGLLGAAAIASRALARRSGREYLAVHSAIFLLAALLFSGLLQFAYGTLVGTMPPAPDLAIWIAAATAIVCYALGRGMVNIGVSIIGTIALISWGIIFGIFATAGVSENASAVAVMRTMVICAAAVAAASSGRRWRRDELLWTARAVMALGGVKLLLDDFRHSGPAAVALSLVCFGAVLILLPRWTRSEDPFGAPERRPD
jgi:hypothetical protein